MQMMDSSAADELLANIRWSLVSREVLKNLLANRPVVKQDCTHRSSHIGMQMVAAMCNSLVRQSFASGIRACACVSQSHWSLRLLSWSLWQPWWGLQGIPGGSQGDRIHMVMASEKLRMDSQGFPINEICRSESIESIESCQNSGEAVKATARLGKILDGKFSHWSHWCLGQMNDEGTHQKPKCILKTLDDGVFAGHFCLQRHCDQWSVIIIESLPRQDAVEQMEVLSLGLQLQLFGFWDVFGCFPDPAWPVVWWNNAVISVQWSSAVWRRAVDV